MRKLFLSVLVGIVLAGTVFGASLGRESDTGSGGVLATDIGIIPVSYETLPALENNYVTKNDKDFIVVGITGEDLGVSSMDTISRQLSPWVHPGQVKNAVNGINAQPEVVLLC